MSDINDESRAFMKDMRDTVTDMKVGMEKHQGEINTQVGVITEKVENYIKTTSKEVVDCRTSRKAIYEKIETNTTKISNVYKSMYACIVTAIGTVVTLLKYK